MAQEYPFYLAGQWKRSADTLPVTNPWDDALVGSTWLADDADVEAAIAAAVSAAPTMRALPAYERGAILARASAVLTRRREEIGRTLAGEAGKPIRDALTEVDRAAMTFHVASEEARRLGGEVIPLDLALQLPPQPVGAQAGAGGRCRQSHRPEARHEDAAVGPVPGQRTG